MTSPLIGAWKLISDTKEGTAFYTERQYSVVVMGKNRIRFKGDEPTQDEMADAYRTFWASSGTYEISNQAVNIFKEIICRNPNEIGREAYREFTVENAKMKDRIVPFDGNIDERDLTKGEWRHWERMG